MRNVKALSPFEILFAVDKGVAYYNSKSQERKVIVREPDSRFILTTYDANNDLICMGSYDGKIFLYSIAKEKYVHKAFEIAKPAFEGQIVNCIKFLDQNNLITSCNDTTVKLWDLEMMKPKMNLKFKDPINIAELSPDGNLLGVYGDCL
jgi:WD40 repeat protein